MIPMWLRIVETVFAYALMSSVIIWVGYKCIVDTISEIRSWKREKPTTEDEPQQSADEISSMIIIDERKELVKKDSP